MYSIEGMRGKVIARNERAKSRVVYREWAAKESVVSGVEPSMLSDRRGVLSFRWARGSSASR